VVVWIKQGMNAPPSGITVGDYVSFLVILFHVFLIFVTRNVPTFLSYHFMNVGSHSTRRYKKMLTSKNKSLCSKIVGICLSIVRGGGMNKAPQRKAHLTLDDP
jgi:hypothetical protein